MRKLLLLFALLAISLDAAAEITPSAEIKFLGVPLGSEYAQFEEALTAKKFKRQKGNEEVASYTGKTDGRDSEVILGMKDGCVIMAILNIKADMIGGGMLYEQLIETFTKRYKGYRVEVDTSNLSKGTAIAFFGPDGCVYLSYRPSESKVVVSYSVNTGTKEAAGISTEDL